MRPLSTIDAKIATWLLACALTGCLIGSVTGPQQDKRSQRPSTMRYTRNNARIYRMNLKRRGGA